MPVEFAGGSHARLLVVEDEPVLRAMLADELRDVGIEVLEAGTADEALAHFDSGAAIDLLFTDVQMPGRMNGVELARHVGARHPSVAVIVTSGNLGGLTVHDLPRFLPKPYRIDAAITLIFQTLTIEGPLPRQ